MTNTILLKKAIEESGLRIYFVAKKLGITYPTLRKKVNGEREFLASEILILTELLHLSPVDRDRIFFASGVVK